ncbi:MAG: methylated-DNA--[protein]-cysteine S-methyltransferase [Sarcina sp.]
MKEYRYVQNFIIGKLLIKVSDTKLKEISFYNGLEDNIIFERNKIIDNTILQLEEYFAGSRKNFDLPLEFNGTEFQERVWKSLLEIPYGESATYKDIAKMIGNEKAVRAVGGANNKNKIMIVIPCHRVIGSNGKLVGYAGGITIKQILLELESFNRL